jgi:hypothetical protein
MVAQIWVMPVRPRIEGVNGIDLSTTEILRLAKIPSGRKKSAILEIKGSFGGDFRLRKGCLAITDRREDSSECVAKDWQTHFSPKRWPTIMKDEGSSAQAA